MRAVDIKWETDGDKAALESLPTEIQLPRDVGPDAVDDYLSDQTGWLHRGYELLPDARIEAREISKGVMPGNLDWKAYRLESFDDAVEVYDAMNWGHDDEQLAALENILRGAEYPCWALFWADANLETGCAGPAMAIKARVDMALDAIAAEAAGHER